MLPFPGARPRARRPLRAHRRIVGAVTALAVLSLTSACASSDAADELAPEPAATSSAPVPGLEDEGAFSATDADFEAVELLLSRRAAAVRTGDARAFLADVDVRDPRLLAEESALFANLDQLPLRRYSYATQRVGLLPDPVGGRDPVLRIPVTELVQVRDVFSAPTEVELRMTFVRRDGRWVLGAESRVEPTAPGDRVAGRPWWGVPVDVTLRGPLVVMTDRADEGLGPRLADLVEEAVDADADALGVPAERAVLVDATSNGTAVRLNTLSQAEAGAVFSAVLGRDGRIVGGAVQINPTLDAEQLASDTGLLRHELTHYLLRATAGTAPSWATEGIAEYAHWQPLGLEDLQVTPELWSRLEAAPRELPTTGLFQLDSRVNYLVAFAAVQHLVSLGGTDQLLRLLDRYREDFTGVEGDVLTRRLLGEVYGLSEADLVRGTWSQLDLLQH